MELIENVMTYSDQVVMLIRECESRHAPNDSTMFAGLGFEIDFSKEMTPQDLKRIFRKYPTFKRGRSKYTFAKYIIEILHNIDMWRVGAESGKNTFFRYLRWYGIDNFKILQKEYNIIDSARGGE